MCLAVPGRIIKIQDSGALVDFGGARREVSLSLTPDAGLNDYVLVHAGFSIQVLDPDEAKATLELFKEIYDPR
ncbi:MAG: HypC/HybG/HupF family hydrogenase formation chaperone [Elusimicrobia bacterium CG08_land_8_20_14_0_20_51_18]|nr:MAG: HypC/HybG/HupF family hydrogenase formation chaperone [Elusimicrobia bacterium CG08_land_8_20_14_0_20_51_18]